MCRSNVTLNVMSCARNVFISLAHVYMNTVVIFRKRKTFWSEKGTNALVLFSHETLCVIVAKPAENYPSGLTFQLSKAFTTLGWF